MITLIAKLTAKPGKEALLYEECRNIVKLVRENEPGNKMYVPHVLEKNPAVVVFVEKYENQEALDIHLNSPYFKALAAKFDELLDGPGDLQILKDLE